MASVISPDQWCRVEEIFHAAVAVPEPARAGLLDRECAGDAVLRAEVESLLLSESALGERDFLADPLQRAAHDLFTHRDLAPGEQFEQYEVVSKLGSGGMGSVYLVEDRRLRRRAALKTISPELVHSPAALRRFEQEARAASALNHPNVLTIYDIGQHGGAPYIASEFVEGRTLRQMLNSGPLDVARAADIASQIASGLGAAHERGIVHRDVKPENIMVRDDGLVKIVDFGISKLSENTKPGEVESATQPGAVIGTVRYMSPEQARGLAVDARSDVFSLAAVLYEMIAGRPPFEGSTTSDVIAGILRGEAPPLPKETPLELRRIVARGLQKELGQRYPGALPMLEDLRAIRSFAPPRRMPWGVLVPLVFAILLCSLGGYLFLHRETEAVTRPRSIAVLPFRNIRQDPATDFLGFSLADAVITKLGYVQSLAVRPSSSIDRYRNQTVDPQKVARDLDADTLLTGSFMKDGDDLRINAQLISVKPMRILWRDTIDVKYEKLLSVQDRVVAQIIAGLELNLSPGESQKVRFDNPIGRHAYEAYLRGVDLYAKNDFEGAIQALENSAKAAPDYALTWAYLGRAYTTHASLQFGGREDYARAQAAYQRALQLNPSLIEPRVYMSNLFTDTGRVEQALPLLREALAANPNSAEAHWELGYAYRFAGYLSESLTECVRARQLDPAVKMNSSALNTWLYLGYYDQFLASLPRVDAVYIVFYRGFAEYYKQEYVQALVDFDRAYALNPKLLQAEVGKAIALGYRHQQEAGLQLLRETEKRILDRGVSDPEANYKLAQAYAVLGDRGSALRILRRSVEGGFFCYPYIANDPLTLPLRAETEFSTILEQAHQRHLQFGSLFLNHQ